MTIADYEQRLRDHHVILSAAERREKIRDGTRRGCGASPIAALLETLVYLTEYPTPITGQLRSAVPGAAGRSSGRP